jgi:lysophospholipase L1-like esterase
MAHASTRRLRPPHGPLFWLGYLALCTALILLGMEAAVRLRGLAPCPSPRDTLFMPDSILPYRLRPSVTIVGRSDSDEFDFRYQHNRLGFRGPEISREKPPNVFRIVALGDSFTYGLGVDYENTFAHRLELLFNAREGNHLHIEVINAGIPRFYPEAERRLLEHYVLNLAPNLVLVIFVPNDVIDTHDGNDAVGVSECGYLITRDAVRTIAALPLPMRWLFRQSHLTRWLLARVVKARRGEKRRHVWSDVYVENGFHEPAWREVERQYAAMVTLAHEHGTLIAFAHLPQREPLNETAVYPGTRLARFCTERGVPFIDLLVAMRTTQRERVLYWPRDGHPNAEGTRVIAGELFARLGQIVP